MLCDFMFLNVQEFNSKLKTFYNSSSMLKKLGLKICLPRDMKNTRSSMILLITLAAWNFRWVIFVPFSEYFWLDLASHIFVIILVKTDHKRVRSAFETPSVKSQTIYSITKIYAKSSHFEQDRRKTKRERKMEVAIIVVFSSDEWRKNDPLLPCGFFHRWCRWFRW